MPRNGLPAAIAERIGSTRRRDSRAAIASRNAPTPGSTSFEASANTAASLVIVAVCPVRSNAFSTLRRLPMP